MIAHRISTLVDCDEIYKNSEQRNFNQLNCNGNK